MEKKHCIFIGLLLLLIVCLSVALIRQVQDIRAVKGGLDTLLRVADGLEEKIDHLESILGLTQ